MYHMSKSDKNWPSSEIFEFELIEKQKLRFCRWRAASGARGRRRRHGRRPRAARAGDILAGRKVTYRSGKKKDEEEEEEEEEDDDDEEDDEMTALLELAPSASHLAAS